MKLFYAKGACSLAPHIAFIEAGLPVDLEPVALGSKTYRAGNFFDVNPKGSVPVIQWDNGEYLTEVAVILQYISDRKPEAHLMPKEGTNERYRCHEWLNYVATEMHKGFSPLFNPSLSAEAKDVIRAGLEKRFEYLAKRLTGDYLMGSTYSVADPYLYTVLTWAGAVGLDFAKHAPLKAYFERVGARPATKAAQAAEGINK